MRRFVLGIAMTVSSLVPTVGMANDQQIADFIKTRLHAQQQSGNLKGFDVDMVVEQGVVTFSGRVSTDQQEMLILTTAQQAGHLGVIRVVDDIEVMSNISNVPAPFQTASYQQQVAPQRVMGNSGNGNGNVPMAFASAGMGNQPMMSGNSYDDGSIMMGRAPMMGSQMGEPMMGGQMGAPMMGGQMGAPMMGGPMGGGNMAGGSMESPNLPGYAWPGYAASPNYGAVSYPKQYSPSAWPYIGPFYPYPQVPLGWRKVTLEWDDGWWFLDFNDK